MRDALARATLPGFFALARVVRPVWRMGDVYVATRSDDVRQILLEPHRFRTPYKANLDVIMGDEPFFLAIDDMVEHDSAAQSLRRAVRRDDLATLAAAIEDAAEAEVAAGKGRLEIVDALGRRPVFDVLTPYLGLPATQGGALAEAAQLLFEFQFADDRSAWLRAAAVSAAHNLRAQIDATIDERRAAGAGGHDDVLGRLMALQALEGAPSDAAIRSALIGLIVGGLPQPAIAVAQALDQLLRRPQALKGAQSAARVGDDARLAAHLYEALRFDSLAPVLTRVAGPDCVIAPGTRRQILVPEGKSVLAAVSSAAMDGRRTGAPRLFNPHRLDHERLHFGLGLHSCFASHMNGALLPRLVKPLLARDNLRRAPGRSGRLQRAGPFASSLCVLYD